MSGFAHLTGTPDGPPTLPSFMLADGVAALTATYAVMMALYHRDVQRRRRAADRHQPDRAAGPPAREVGADLRPARHDPGQDRQPVGHQRTAQHLPDQRRPLAGDVEAAPRRSPCARLRAVDRPELADDPKFAEAQQRLRNAAEIDAIMADWIGQRTLDEALAVFEQAGVAAAPIYDAEQLLDDQHLAGARRSTRRSRPGTRLDAGPGTRAPPLRHPGRLQSPGPAARRDNAEVYRELLGLDGEPPGRTT